MLTMKPQRLWELPILPAHVVGVLERLSSWVLKETRKSAHKIGQHVGMVSPSLNVALHLLPKMALQQQLTVPWVYNTVSSLVASLSPSAQGVIVPGTGRAFKWLA